MKRSKEARILDKISASRMHLESHVALSSPASITLRFKLARLGVDLESESAKSLIALVDELGWEMLGRCIKIRCFMIDPSVKSSLKFLRRTPWARKKVEDLYLEHLR